MLLCCLTDLAGEGDKLQMDGELNHQTDEKWNHQMVHCWIQRNLIVKRLTYWNAISCSWFIPDLTCPDSSYASSERESQRWLPWNLDWVGGDWVQGLGFRWWSVFASFLAWGFWCVIFFHFGIKLVSICSQINSDLALKFKYGNFHMELPYFS